MHDLIHCSLDLHMHDSCLHLCLFGAHTCMCACVSVGIDNFKILTYHFVFYSTYLPPMFSSPFLLRSPYQRFSSWAPWAFDPHQSLSWGLDCAFTMVSSSSILGLYPLDAGRASVQALTIKIAPDIIWGNWGKTIVLDRQWQGSDGYPLQQIAYFVTMF